MIVEYQRFFKRWLAMNELLNDQDASMNSLIHGISPAINLLRDTISSLADSTSMT